MQTLGVYILRVPIYLGSQITWRSMESDTAVNLHRFGDGLLVEVVGTDPDGEVSVRSFEFEPVEPGATTVRPRSSLPSSTTMMLEEHIAAAGYELVTKRVNENGSSPPKPGEMLTR